MTHDEIRELLGAYVLDAVSAEESSIVQQHLKTCQDCTNEVASLREVPDWLALSATELEPPPQLRIRLMNLVEQDRITWERGRAGNQSAVQPPARAGWWQGVWDRLMRVPARAYGIAGAIVVAAVIAAIVLLNRQSITVQLHTGGAVAAVVDGFSFQGVTAQVAVRSNHTTDVSFTNLPVLPPQLAYELWFIPPKGNPAPIVGFEANATRSYSVRLKRDAASYLEAAVTIERAPGDSPTPNSKALAIAVKLQS
jgi:anti-sigma-K factor RskA